VSEQNNYLNVPPEVRVKAKVFFEKAAAVAGAGQYDYAIDMFLSGLGLDPDAIEAHQSLRDTGLRRKASGGKGPGMFESVSGKTDREKLLSIEKLLAKEPGERKYMAQLMEFAYKAGCYDTVLWIAPILYRANNEHPKPDFIFFQKVRDHYAKLERWAQAVEATQRMLQLRPDEMDLKNDLKNLSAREAMTRGNYDKKGGSFRDSVRDADKQRDLIEAEKDHTGEDFLQKTLKDAEVQLAADPKEPGKMRRVLESILKFGTPQAEKIAIKRGSEFFEITGLFSFRLQVLKLQLKELQTEFRRLQKEVVESKNDPEKVENLKSFVNIRAQQELEIFQEASDQYPTDNSYKFEIANRMVQLDRFGEAIPIYQQVVGDPKIRTAATLKLGQTFLAAEFADEAVDTLKGLIDTYQTQGDDLAKQIYYWHGRALESKSDFPSALKSYSQVVKWDFNFLDVQTRMKKLRALISPAST